MNAHPTTQALTALAVHRSTALHGWLLGVVLLFALAGNTASGADSNAASMSPQADTNGLFSPYAINLELADNERRLQLFRHLESAKPNATHDLPRQTLDLRLKSLSSTRFLGGQLQPSVGSRFSLAGESRELYVDADWKLSPSSPLSLSLGIGAVSQAIPNSTLNDGPERRLLLHVPIEATFKFNDNHSASLYYDRLSNEHNDLDWRTSDSLGLRYGFTY